MLEVSKRRVDGPEDTHEWLAVKLEVSAIGSDEVTRDFAVFTGYMTCPGWQDQIPQRQNEREK